MPIVSISLFVTTVAGGIAQGDSQLVTLQINDTNNDGSISRDEWQAYTGNPNGHLAGNTIPPALFNGISTGNVMDGRLYTPISYSNGDDLTALLKGLAKSKYNPSVDGLTACYLAGTMILTPDGEVAVETLKAGDIVMTADHGPQVLVWTAQSEVTPDYIRADDSRRPIRIAAGALGPDQPRREVLVSPQHRVVMDCGGIECMISARHLAKIGMPGVTVAVDLDSFTLVHIACREHEILWAEGARMESFFTGPEAVKALAVEDHVALCDAFPELLFGVNPMTPAREFIKWREFEKVRQRALTTA